MTKEEAIKILNAVIYIIPKEYCNEEIEGAIEMSIKSLEAWEIVKGNLKYYADNIKFNDAYREGFEISLKIIDNYLSEVEG